MAEPAEGQNPMSTERPTEGIMPIEQRQVEQAAFEARMKQKAEEARREGRPIPIGGGTQDREGVTQAGGAELPPEIRDLLSGRSAWAKEFVSKPELLRYISPQKIQEQLRFKLADNLGDLHEHGKFPPNWWRTGEELHAFRASLYKLRDIAWSSGEEKVQTLLVDYDFSPQELVELGALTKEETQDLEREVNGRKVVDADKLREKIREEEVGKRLEARVDNLLRFERFFAAYRGIMDVVQIQKSRRGDIDEYRKLAGRMEAPLTEDYQALGEAPPLLEGTPLFGDLLNTTLHAWIEVAESPVGPVENCQEALYREAIRSINQGIQEKGTKENVGKAIAKFPLETRRVALKDILENFGKKQVEEEWMTEAFKKSIQEALEGINASLSKLPSETQNELNNKADEIYSLMQVHKEFKIKNPFCIAPNATLRNNIVRYIKDKLFESYDPEKRTKGEGVLNEGDKRHEQIAELAAKASFTLLFEHWDMPPSYATEINVSGEFAGPETAWNDIIKMQYFALRAITERRSYRAPFGNWKFTALMFNPTVNFLRMVGPFLESNKRDKEGAKVRRRVSLETFFRDCEVHLKDLPWIAYEDKELIGKYPQIQKIPYFDDEGKKEENAQWSEVTEMRDDALAVPYFLQLAYSGMLYESASSRQLPDIIKSATKWEFWSGFNKPFDVGLQILVRAQGLRESTAKKLILITKINLVASIVASLGLLSVREKIIEGTTGRTFSYLDVYDAVWSSNFLRREEVVPGRQDMVLVVENILNKQRGANEALLPDDKLLTTSDKKPLFSPEEIQLIDDIGIYSPFSIQEIDPKTKQRKTNYIGDAYQALLSQK